MQWIHASLVAHLYLLYEDTRIRYPLLSFSCTLLVTEEPGSAIAAHSLVLLDPLVVITERTTTTTRSDHSVVIENERADVKAATRNAVDRQRCGSHLFFHRLGRPERVPGIWNCQEPTFRPERRSRPAKPTAPRRPPRRANTRVRASWTHQGLLGPSQLNRDAQSARNRRPGAAPAT